MTCGILSPSLSILLVADLFHPVHNLPVECFLNGDVRHGSCRRSAMPMLQSWRKPNHITGPNLLDRTALSLHPANTRCDNERLTKWMRVPRGARARFEGDACARDACRSICLKQRINTHRASEPISRSFRGCLRADSFDFHTFLFHFCSYSCSNLTPRRCSRRTPLCSNCSDIAGNSKASTRAPLVLQRAASAKGFGLGWVSSELTVNADDDNRSGKGPFLFGTVGRNGSDCCTRCRARHPGRSSLFRGAICAQHPSAN